MRDGILELLLIPVGRISIGRNLSGYAVVRDVGWIRLDPIQRLLFWRKLTQRSLSLLLGGEDSGNLISLTIEQVVKSLRVRNQLRSSGWNVRQGKNQFSIVVSTRFRVLRELRSIPG